MRVLVTGCAGFIGFHLSKKLLARGDEVVGIDNLNDYYDPALKQARLKQLTHKNFSFSKTDLADRDALTAVFKQYKPQRVVNLAAQAGVRYSLESPETYVHSNLVGFANILENCRHFSVENLVYASSSSVYGSSKKYPFSEKDAVNHPVALYGATKKANEVMAHSYAHLFNLSCTGLRFFTVYGPWGRPDMALFKFTKNILEGKPIQVYNFGKMARDFTYIDDIVEGVVRTLDNPATKDANWHGEDPASGSSNAPYRIYNIGYGSPVKLMDFVHLVEKELGKSAQIEMLPLQAGDVEETFADTTALQQQLGYKPVVSINEGVQRFVAWYKEHYGISGSCAV